MLYFAFFRQMVFHMRSHACLLTMLNINLKFWRILMPSFAIYLINDFWRQQELPESSRGSQKVDPKTSSSMLFHISAFYTFPFLVAD